MVRENEHETTSAVERKEHRPVVALTPLFSWRSIKILGIGFIVGVGLGIGYFIISPLFNSSGGEAWKSAVEFQIVNASSSSMSRGDLQSKGISYTAKANSLSFLEFLSQGLTQQTSQYHYTVDELDQILNIGYRAYQEIPTIEVGVITPTIEETTFLITYIPETFKSYLIAEESNKQEQEYENTLKAREITKTVLLEVEQELSSTDASLMAARDKHNDPTYIALNAKVKALESELERQAANLSGLIAAGNAGEYSNMPRAKTISAALSEAEQELRALELKRSDISKNVTYITLNAKIEALQAELDKLMTGYTVVTDGSETRIRGLAESIADGATTDTAYTILLNKIERVTTALVEAREELSILESQTGGNGSEEDLDNQLTQAEESSDNQLTQAGESSDNQLTQAEESSDNQLAQAGEELDYQLAQTKVATLKERLAILARISVEAENQQDAQAVFERTSTALSEARKELSILESQTGNNSSEEYLDYQLTQAKAENLNKELAILNNKLSSLLVTNTGTGNVVDYLAVGNPDTPALVLPVRLRTALLVGVIVGIGGAWVTMNFRWLTTDLSSSREEEEDEA